jgi:hypothetical protein
LASAIGAGNGAVVSEGADLCTGAGESIAFSNWGEEAGTCQPSSAPPTAATAPAKSMLVVLEIIDCPFSFLLCARQCARTCVVV